MKMSFLSSGTVNEAESDLWRSEAAGTETCWIQKSQMTEPQPAETCWNLLKPDLAPNHFFFRNIISSLCLWSTLKPFQSFSLIIVNAVVVVRGWPEKEAKIWRVGDESEQVCSGSASFRATAGLHSEDPISVPPPYSGTTDNLEETTRKTTAEMKNFLFNSTLCIKHVVTIQIVSRQRKPQSDPHTSNSTRLLTALWW